MSDSSWSPGGARPPASASFASASFDLSTSSSSENEGSSSSVSSSDLDEFIMSTSQSAALSRQRKKQKKGPDGYMPVAEGRKQKRKKKKKAKLSTPAGRVSQEVRDLLGNGHNAFLKRDYDTAVSLLEEAIRLAPGLADPFVTLGAIYEELGDPKRSLEALLVAVHLTPGDTELWQRVAVMSQTVGNPDQAIYCYKRCVKAAAGDKQQEEPFLRELSQLYVQTSKFQEAATILRKLFRHAVGDEKVELGAQLAKSLYNINEKPEAMVVLESLLGEAAVDANVINMLAEVYLDVREWGRCFSLLTGVLDMDHLSDPDKCPVDLVAKLALAAAPSLRHEKICRDAIACVAACAVETHYDLYLLVAEGFMGNSLFELALSLLTPAVSVLSGLAESDPSSFLSVAVQCKAKAGRCLYAQREYALAAEYLSAYAEFEKSENRKPEPDSLVMLADAWRHTGRETEAAELLLHSLNYEDLLACRTLPAATSTTQRRKSLDTLQHLLETIETQGVEVAAEPMKGKFASTFLQLLNDCELDSQRIARHRLQAGEEETRVTPAWRLRKELDLESVEDVLGPSRFVDLIVRGARVCASVSRAKEAVELVEAVLYNKRKKWSQRQVIGATEVLPPTAVKTETAEQVPEVAMEMDGDGQLLVETLEKLSYELATAGGVNKVATKYLRQQVVESLEAGNFEVVDSAIAKMTKLMFVTESLSQREILDQRSWLVRQACKHPTVFALCMFCGHLCVYSQNFRFATQEYMRAHRLRPEDPWPLLCLGASLLSLAMSRTTKDRQFTVLKAFAVLAEYKRKRLMESPRNLAETHFNIGRAFHQLSLWTLADRHYRTALDLSSDATDNALRRSVAYNLSLIRQRSGLVTEATDLLLTNIVAR